MYKLQNLISLNFKNNVNHLTLLTTLDASWDAGITQNRIYKLTNSTIMYASRNLGITQNEI